MIRPISYRFLVLFFIGVLSIALTGCGGGGGGGGSGVGPIISAGNGSVSGSVSTASMANIRANGLQVASPAPAK